MPLVTFILGLALGLGYCLWQRFRFRRELRQSLSDLEIETSGSPPVLLYRLRRAIASLEQGQDRCEQQLQTWQQMLHLAPVAYLQVDEENQLLWCNPQARQLLKIPNWDPTELPLLLKLVRSYELDRLIEQTRTEQHPRQQDWVFHPPPADAQAVTPERSQALRAHAWPLPNGQVGVFLENRQPLVALAQSRERWVSELAHELRTPLTSIQLVVEALHDRLEPPMQRWVDRLLPETNRLINLVQDWLELSHLEAEGESSLRCSRVELRELVQSVWHTLEPLASQKQLHFRYRESNPIEIEVDESKFYRVFLNLLDNSIRYSDPESEIRIEATQIGTEGDRTVQINVIDSGEGFPESDLPRVFERLYRGGEGRSRDSVAQSNHPVAAVSSSSGSGLGLAIVQHIVQAHGGSVSAKNHPETGGAWVQIQLNEF